MSFRIIFSIILSTNKKLKIAPLFTKQTHIYTMTSHTHIHIHTHYTLYQNSLQTILADNTSKIKKTHKTTHSPEREKLDCRAAQTKHSMHFHKHYHLDAQLQVQASQLYRYSGTSTFSQAHHHDSTGHLATVVPEYK